MKHFNKILIGLGILLWASGLSSCSIAVKAVYNQFSDEDEFILFQGDRRAQTRPRPEERNKEPEVRGQEPDLKDGIYWGWCMGTGDRF